MPDPAGFYAFNGNGSEGSLHIEPVDSQGNLRGTLLGNPISGFWDDAAQKLTFIRVINAADPSTFQVYTGYFFDQDRSTMAGFFEAFSGSGGSAQRSVYGWFAQILIV